MADNPPFFAMFGLTGSAAGEAGRGGRPLDPEMFKLAFFAAT